MEEQLANGWMYRHGNQGQLDGASKGQLEAEFGSSKDDDVVAQLLEKGTIIETEVRYPPSPFPLPCLTTFEHH